MRPSAYRGQRPQQCSGQQQSSHRVMVYLLSERNECSRRFARGKVSVQVSQALVEVAHLIHASAQLVPLLADDRSQFDRYLRAPTLSTHAGQFCRLLQWEIELPQSN